MYLQKHCFCPKVWVFASKFRNWIKGLILIKDDKIYKVFIQKERVLVLLCVLGAGRGTLYGITFEIFF